MASALAIIAAFLYGVSMITARIGLQDMDTFSGALISMVFSFFGSLLLIIFWVPIGHFADWALVYFSRFIRSVYRQIAALYRNQSSGKFHCFNTLLDQAAVLGFCRGLDFRRKPDNGDCAGNRNHGCRLGHRQFETIRKTG
jgi:hypothetical protein